MGGGVLSSTIRAKKLDGLHCTTRTGPRWKSSQGGFSDVPFSGSFSLDKAFLLVS